MKVWLDDVRPMPFGFTDHAKTADEAIRLLSTGLVSRISLDHDLDIQATLGQTPTEKTGYDVACWIEQAVAEGRIQMPCWEVHSMNPSGKARIVQAMKSAARRIPQRQEGGR